MKPAAVHKTNTVGKSRLRNVSKQSGSHGGFAECLACQSGKSPRTKHQEEQWFIS